MDRAPYGMELGKCFFNKCSDADYHDCINIALMRDISLINVAVIVTDANRDKYISVTLISSSTTKILVLCTSTIKMGTFPVD